MKTYTIRLELDATPDPEAFDNLIDNLSGYHPAVAPNGRRTDVIISLPAADLGLAVRTALLVIADATPANAIAVQAMPADEWDARLGLAPSPELVSVSEAAELAGVSRQAILQRLETGSLTGQKVGNAWVVNRRDVERVRARVMSADGHELARVDVVYGQPLTYEGTTYVPTGGSHSAMGGPRVHTYVPEK